MKEIYRYTHKEIIGNSFVGKVRISGALVLETYSIIKETKCGYWIKYKDDKKWINSIGTKAFARTSKMKALDDFIKRKRKQISFIELNIKVLKEALLEANNKYNLR